MQPHHLKQYGSLFIVLALVATLLGVPALPVRAAVPASVHFTLNSLSTPITTITRVSVDSSGMQGNDDSKFPSISADGRYVAFYSSASNLVSGDTNGHSDVFVRDTQTGTTTLISVDSNGVQGNSASDNPSISADGRYVAFRSWASNLVSGDSNDADDIFLRDTHTGTTTRLSVDSSGVEGNNGLSLNASPSISADGHYVAFYSYASNLVSGDTNDAGDIFLRDIPNSITTRLSVNSSGVQGDGNSDSFYSPSISADGRYVAFTSAASNLVSGDTNNALDIFLRDTHTGTTTRISVDSSGTQANGWSDSPSISADGHYVAFYSYASNLVSLDTNSTDDIFLRDMQTSTTKCLSLDSGGVQGDNDSDSPSISADGRYVVFRSLASNLVSGESNWQFNIFLRDMQTGTNTRLTQGNHYSESPSISADGRYVAFDSEANNLVSGDTNGALDVFVVPAATIFTNWIYLPLVIR